MEVIVGNRDGNSHHRMDLFYPLTRKLHDSVAGHWETVISNSESELLVML